MAAIITDVTKNFSLSLSQYNLSNAMRAYEKDGEQALWVTTIALARLQVLAMQLQPIAPSLLANIPFFSISIGLAVAPSIVSFIQEHTKQYSLIDLTNVKEFLTKHIDVDAIANTACCISYVALIALGFPLSGGFGLAGLALIALKRNFYLPALAIQLLRPLSLVAGVTSVYFFPMHTAVRLLILSILSAHLLREGLSHVTISKEWFPNLFHPFHGLHKKDPPILFTDHLIDPANLTVNPTHIFTDRLEQLFSPEALNAPENAHELFDQLFEKIKTEKIVLTDREKQGLENIKIGTIDGFVSDVLPPNVPLFKKTLCVQIHSILQDSLNLSIKVRELAELGHSCVLGWTRDIIALQNPNTSNIEWAIHYELAMRRGELVKEAAGEAIKDPSLFGVSLGSAAEFVGGTNNDHFLVEIQKIFAGKYRTYEAELHLQMDPPSVPGNFWYRGQTYFEALQNNLRHSNHTVKNVLGFNLRVLETLWLSVFDMGTVHPSLTLHHTASILQKCREKTDPYFYDPEILVDYTYEAIKPEKRINEKGDVEEWSRISPKAIQTWLMDMQQRHPEVDLDALDNKWLEPTLFGYCLTKEGIRLLLWDLGILNAKSPSFESPAV
ncbi:MAG: hypothetical protein Q8L98_06575 [Chlamydiales bacterium]|nr:hypothetical protein [Chlamydiales bacterium]